MSNRSIVSWGACFIVLLTYQLTSHSAAAYSISGDKDSSDLPTSKHVEQLNEFTFYGKVGNGSVWFVEFYTPGCLGCKRVASQWSMVADMLADDPNIKLARLNCDPAEKFCTAIGINRTPSFKVFYNGKEAYDYKADVYVHDLMYPFIKAISQDLLGYEAAGQGMTTAEQEENPAEA
eukprot:jgi/Chrzof1/8923/Cz03g29090.t1_PDI-1